MFIINNKVFRSMDENLALLDNFFEKYCDNPDAAEAWRAVVEDYQYLRSITSEGM